MTTDPDHRRVQVPGEPSLPGLVIRHLDRERDFPAVAELICTANLHDGADWLPGADALRHDWEHAVGLDLAEDVLVAELDGTLIGYVEQSWRIRGAKVMHQLQPMVRPEHRHRGLGRALLAWAEQRVARGLAAGTLGPAELPHLLCGWADLEIPEVAPFAEAAGYRVEGYGVMMTRPLADAVPETALPAGLEVRPVRPEDHRRIWEADTEAFQDHRDPTVRTESDYQFWFSQPDLDTSIWQVAWDGEEVAGSVMNFIFVEENERLGIRRGWLEHISVRRPWRKRGLATALTLRSLAMLRDLGLEEAALGADAKNLTGAVRLYEELGFRRVRTSAGYRKPIEVRDPGAAQPTEP
jgi:GNAT superfamily N-acetyltransferase